MKRFVPILVLVLALSLLGARAWAANCPSLPYTLTNGTTADANQVMGNFNQLLGCANAVTGLVGVKVFTASGTYTCDTGTNKIIVEVIGGGGGGGGAGASTSTTSSMGPGGSAAGYYKGLVTANFCGAAVTVGAGGSGGVGNGAPGTGGTSSLVLSGGVSITCTGGPGNAAPDAGATGFVGGAAGGSCTASGAATILNLTGWPGGWCYWNTTLGVAGYGASSPLGPGGTQQAAPTAFQEGGGGGGGYGSGGGGAISFLKSSGGAAQTGGPGAPGVVIIYELM